MTLEFARRLIDMGVPVFVAKANPEKPSGFDFPSGWQHTKANRKALESWTPGDALCAVSGVVLDFIDVDPRNGGDDGWRELRDKGLLPRIYATVATPSGGRHHYIARLRIAKTKHAGIDYQSGDDAGDGRGFVFLPGTQRVSKADGTVRGYEVITDALDSFGQDENTAAPLLRFLETSAPASGGAGRIGEPIPKGSHDATLAAYTLTALLRHGGDLRMALRDVRERAGDCVPPWTGPDSVERCFSSRWLPGALKKVAAKGWQPDQPPNLEFPEDEEDGGPKPVDWAQLWADLSQDRWLIEPILGEGAQTVLYSPPKVGKSILALEMCAALAAGNRRVLGVTTGEPRNVLYVDHENRLRADVRTRLQDMGYGPDDLKHLHFYSFPAMPPLDTAPGGQALLAMAQEHQAELVVIDTISRAVAGEENSNDTWNRVYRLAGKLLKREGIALLRIDHTGKDRSAGQRGGSAKSGDPDLVWELVPAWDEVTFALACKAARLELPKDYLCIGRERNPLCHRIDTGGRLAWMAAARAHIADCLDEIGAPPQIAVTAAVDALEAAEKHFVKGLVTAEMLTWRRGRNV